MSSTDYQLYNQSVRRLTDTLILKSEVTAERLNMRVEEEALMPVSSNPRTWLYYLNLSGEYHPTQTPMTVTSLDTLEEIAFTKENMLRHRLTARAYAYGSDYFNQLLEQYPDQRMLILGILNPIDIDKAINARNHEILWYDTNEVEGREINLIPLLQKQIDDFFRRWEHVAYETSDLLYWPAIYALLFLGMPQMIKGIRWENCHTNYAHSFHIWSFLAGHQGLDRYRRFMTEKQVLWFYRNIMYIERNMGQTKTFDDLIQYLLTDRGIPIGNFTVRQDSTDLPDQLTPTPYMERTPMNLQDQIGFTRTRRGLDFVMQQQFPMAKDNEAFYRDELDTANELVKMSDKSTLSSKVLESEVEDLTDSELYAKYDFLWNEWIHLSAIGYYQAKLSTTNPADGAILTMNMKEAFRLCLYMLNRAMGMEMVEVPHMQANHVRVLTPPTFERLRGITDDKLIADNLIEWCLDKQVEMKPAVSTEEFRNLVNDIYQGWRRHHQMYTLQEHYQARGMAEAIVENFYMDVGVDFGEGELYKQWFLDKDWNFDSLNEDECAILAIDIFNKATAQDLEDVTSLKDIQAGMLSLMKTLSSYTIHIIQTINTDPIKPIEWAAIRLGSKTQSETEHHFFMYAQGKVKETFNSAVEVIKLLRDANPLSNWRESAVESVQATPLPTWTDESGYSNTQYVWFSQQYWSQVAMSPFRDRVGHADLKGLWIPPFPGRPKMDFADRLGYSGEVGKELDGLVVSPIKNFGTRFKNPLNGLWVKPRIKEFTRRFGTGELNGLYPVEFKPFWMRVDAKEGGELNGLETLPVPGPVYSLTELFGDGIAAGFNLPTLNTDGTRSVG